MERSSKRYYAYKIEMVGMTVTLLIVGVAIFLPLVFLKRDIVIAAGQNSLFVIGLVFWFILHEIVHGLSYRMSKGITNQDISFGARLEKGVLFCICTKPISKGAVIRSLLAPFIMMSLVTLVIGIVLNLQLLIVLSLMNACGAVGDILMVLFIAKMPKDMCFFEDSNNRFIIGTNADISKRKSLGVKLEEIEDDFEKVVSRDTARIAISKASYIVVGIACLYTVLSFIGII